MSISMSTVYATAVLSVSSTLASVLFLVSAYRRLERQSVAMLQWRVRVCVCVCVPFQCFAVGGLIIVV